VSEGHEDVSAEHQGAGSQSETAPVEEQVETAPVEEVAPAEAVQTEPLEAPVDPPIESVPAPVAPMPSAATPATVTPATVTPATVTPATVIPATVVPPPAAGSSGSERWGRVDPDGTVYVRIGDGERAVGSYPGAGDAEALGYFARKYDDLAAQVSLLEQRLKAGQVSAGDADSTITKLTPQIAEANAVGDLVGLAARLAGLSPAVQQLRARADRARQQARERSVATRILLVEEAEKIAAEDAERIPWRTAGDRLRELFETWRTLQRESRLDKHTEDELWKRFSHARTGFDRKRRQYFGALDEQRGEARSVKEKIVVEAEALAGSTDWAVTTAAYRALMERWKASGRAARKDDDSLWARFRAAQDAFFAARQGENSKIDAEFAGNLAVKEALLVEAEALLPVTDLAAAKAALRRIQDRWDAAGKVPRADVGRLDGRIRKVETAVRDAEQERWTRANPEALSRAQSVVTALERAVAGLTTDLEKARAKGDERKIRETEQALAARQEWLQQAQRSMQEFSG
jgi:Domain of Unknown Function (DUF349)